MQIRLRDCRKSSSGYEWDVTVINETGQAISLCVANPEAEKAIRMSNTMLGDGQVALTQFSGSDEDPENTLVLWVLDYNEGKILFDTPSFALPTPSE